MNIHFSEILVILLVALVVIKPDRLPEVAFKLGAWLKWARNMVAKVKAEMAMTLDRKPTDPASHE